jgi:hypothetical protein
MPNLQQAARQVTDQVLEEVESLQKSAIPADSDLTGPLAGQSMNSNPKMNPSNSIATVSPSPTGDFHAVKVDAKHRPSIIKYGQTAVDGELKDLDTSITKQTQVFEDEGLKLKSMPVKPERGIENKKAIRPSSSKRTTSKDSIKRK